MTVYVTNKILWFYYRFSSFLSKTCQYLNGLLNVKLSLSVNDGVYSHLISKDTNVSGLDSGLEYTMTGTSIEHLTVKINEEIIKLIHKDIPDVSLEASRLLFRWTLDFQSMPHNSPLWGCRAPGPKLW